MDFCWTSFCPKTLDGWLHFPAKEKLWAVVKKFHITQCRLILGMTCTLIGEYSNRSASTYSISHTSQLGFCSLPSSVVSPNLKTNRVCRDVSVSKASPGLPVAFLWYFRTDGLNMQAPSDGEGFHTVPWSSAQSLQLKPET